MIEVHKQTLSNGLRVVVHEDDSTPLVAINILYNVGAKHESPDKTGFAHLFEHLMFGGSKHIESYDEPLQRVGGDNNAFTTNDITNYYLTVPAENIETGLWLESDRMLELNFSQESLDVQKNVVIEEFKQRYLNQPYGDLTLLYRPQAYKVHPYQWPTIGKEIKHIEDATLEDVKRFFYSHYAPNNAILVIAGNIKHQQAFKLVEKWFGAIPRRQLAETNIPVEPRQQEARIMEVERNVPADLIHMAFHMPSRRDDDYQTTDLISDILSNGHSSRLYLSLLKKQKLFSEINAYISGDDDAGLFIVTGRTNPGIDIHAACKAIRVELDLMMTETITDYELQKVKNKIESTLLFSEIGFLNKAMNLAQFELLSKAEDINLEPQKYSRITAQDIQRVAQDVFRTDNCSTILYKAIPQA
jgi:predicted Zn-dependent peptidase